MTVSIEISTRQNTILHGEHRLSTRSKGLLVFACMLLWKKRAQPNAAWVGLDELSGILPVIHGRQMLRYIDTLADIHFPVEYESKTCGRYRLAIPSGQVTVDLDQDELERFVGIRAGASTAAPRAMDEGRSLPDSASLLESFSRLCRADSQYLDGNLGSDLDHAYHLFLRESETAPPEFRGIALLRLAKTCRRLNRHDEALAALLRMGKLLRSGGGINPGLEDKIQMCKAMVYFDQGRTARATAIIKKMDMRGCTDASVLGEYYNLMGLLAFRELRQIRQEAVKTAAPVDPDAYVALLKIATHYYHQSLAQHTNVSDYQAMQCTCFNLGNLFLYVWNERLTRPDDEQFLELGMKWVAQCEFICHKFGVGMDSVWSRIVMIKTAMQNCFGMPLLNTLCGDLFRHHASLEAMAQATLQEAKAIGNHLEQAQVCEILMRLALERGDQPGAEARRKHVLAIYRDLKRDDLARPFKAALP